MVMPEILNVNIFPALYKSHEEKFEDTRFGTDNSHKLKIQS